MVLDVLFVLAWLVAAAGVITCSSRGDCTRLYADFSSRTKHNGPAPREVSMPTTGCSSETQPLAMGTSGVGTEDLKTAVTLSLQVLMHY